MTPKPQSTTRPTVATELRRAFLDFFGARGHTRVDSSPLVPHGDPSLLFTTAGMVQFKPYYVTTGDVPYTRAVSIQKCLRLTDLENVGLTPRHDTFFEMLGNFSFGPREQGAYFKREAIDFAWEFLHEVLGLPEQKLFATYFSGEGGFPEDVETRTLWRRHLPESHLRALGRADNFWGPAGGQGACGPCSEIYYDLGPDLCAQPAQQAKWAHRPEECYPGADCDRYMEFWNLVLPQYDAKPDGTLTPLARPGIDTGMGIERLAMIMQGRRSIFETDLFAPLVEHVRELAGAGRMKAGTTGPNSAAALRDARIIADHARALTFALAEGALPSNEGAGYVLRRLLRRAVTHGRSRSGLALEGNFLADCAQRVVERFGADYPELVEHCERIERALDQEETAFTRTFEAGQARLVEILEASATQRHVTGEDAFVLHDTYGLPVELTQEIAAERGFGVDLEGFERCMEEQRARARAASKFEAGEEVEGGDWHAVTEGPDSEFLGYAALEAAGLALRRWRPHGDAELDLVLDRTPCYAESGGQVADRGRIEGGGVEAALVDVFREGEQVVHRVRVPAGQRDALLEAGARGALEAWVSPGHRYPTMRHHTATHLLHAALRQVLGTHVRQAGSLVAPDRLRFDYTHFEAPSAAQLAEIERRVNEWVLRNREVSWEVLPLERARSLGAMALFGEKYGAEVRMVTVPGVEEMGIATSRELCGGTHVSRTGDIGAFVLVSDSAIAAGVRRIEALCGHEALRWLKHQSETLHRAAAALQSSPAALPEQVEKLRGELERLRRAQTEATRSGLEGEMARLVEEARTAPGGRWVVAELQSEAEAAAVRDAADKLRAVLKRGAAVLALRSGGKLTFVAAVTDDLVAAKTLRADELVRQVARVTGGSGGGKPHLALAGGKDAGKLAEALAEARRLLAEALGS
jgi:alanyl-tRNA synthetase